MNLLPSTVTDAGIFNAVPAYAAQPTPKITVGGAHPTRVKKITMQAERKLVETHSGTYQGIALHLVKDAAGYWGWIIGDQIHLPYICYFAVAHFHALRRINPTYPY